MVKRSKMHGEGLKGNNWEMTEVMDYNKYVIAM